MKSPLYFFTLLSLALILLLEGCIREKQAKEYASESLKITQLASGTFLHTSFLPTQQFGNVPCNGMLVVHRGEALIFDSPTYDSVSLELIDWVENELDAKIKGVVATHFHIDCLGGLETFHEKNIPSYANNLTLELAKQNEAVVPLNGFEEQLEIKIGGKGVICQFLGEGHTQDNIVGYFSKDKALFGGCLTKALGSGKGNLADANVDEWSNTANRVKATFPEAKIVIPGHGKAGGLDLLDYTAKMFKKE